MADHTRLRIGFFYVAILGMGLLCRPVMAQNADSVCPRPAAGSTIENPPELPKGKDGKFHLTARNIGSGPVDADNPNYDYRFCMRGNDDAKLESPVLRMSPGETVGLTLSNRLQFQSGFPDVHIMPVPGTMQCVPQPANLKSDISLTNLHYHGLNIPPRCGGDETINTIIASPQSGGTPEYSYRFTIPANDPPGLQWYHPHMHGVSQQQIMGGMTGVIIINGMEKLFPEVANLKEQILVLRDQDKPDPGDNDEAPADEPWKNVSVNYVPVTWTNGGAPSPVPKLLMEVGERQFWRVANASADTAFVLKLQYRISGNSNWEDQPMELLAFDGVPQVDDSGSPSVQPMIVKSIVLPPAGRAEFIVTGPPAATEARLYSDDYNSYLLSTNPNPMAADDTDREPARVLAEIQSTPATTKKAVPPRLLASERVVRFMGLRQRSSPRERKFFFTKDPSDEGNFFLTQEGQTPKLFDMSAPPGVTINMPAIEDWIIENRDNESHVFHIHQIHFRVLEINGVAPDESTEPTLRDTIQMPACRDWGSDNPDDLYNGDPTFTGKNCKQPYRLKLRMDFREKEIAGIALFHCHILEHQDKGMMAKMELVWNPRVAAEEAKVLEEQGQAALERKERAQRIVSGKADSSPATAMSHTGHKHAVHAALARGSTPQVSNSDSASRSDSPTESDVASNLRRVSAGENFPRQIAVPE